MKNNLKPPLLALLILATLSSGLVASETKGVFSFPKRAPFVALVYFGDDIESDGPEICGTIDQKNKAFSEKLVAGKTNCDVTFTNSDEMQHNIFGSDSASGKSFDVGLLSPGASTSTNVNWPEGTVVRLGCKIHPKMKSYLANIPSSHYAIVSFQKGDSSVDFTISDVPSGLKQLVIWFPKMDPLEITLGDGESTTVNITRKGKIYGTLNIAR